MRRSSWYFGNSGSNSVANLNLGSNSNLSSSLNSNSNLNPTSTMTMRRTPSAMQINFALLRRLSNSSSELSPSPSTPLSPGSAGRMMLYLDSMGLDHQEVYQTLNSLKVTLKMCSYMTFYS